MSIDKDIINRIIKLSDSILTTGELETPYYTQIPGFSLSKQEYSIFLEIVNLLRKKQEIRNNYSKQELSDRLWDYLLDVFRKSEEYTLNKNSKIAKFVRSLEIPPDEWIVLMPIDGLKSDINRFQIGEVTFDIFKDAEIANFFKRPNDHQMRKGYEEYLKMEMGKVVNGISQPVPKMNFEEYKNSFLEHRERIVENFVGKMCAKVKSKAVDSEKALEIGKYEINTALHVLSTYYGILGTKPKISIKEPTKYITKSHGGQGQCSIEGDWSWGYKIELKDQDNLMKYIDLFEKTLCKPKTRLDRRIIRSIRWCGKAVIETVPEEKLVQYITALECLLSTQNDKFKGEILGKRVGTLFTTDPNQIEKIMKDINDLYNLRSNIVHGSKYEINQKDLDLIDIVTRNVIPTIVKIVQENNFLKIHQLIDWIDKQYDMVCPV